MPALRGVSPSIQGAWPPGTLQGAWRLSPLLGPKLSFAVRTRTSREAERRAARTRRFPEDSEWAAEGGSKVRPGAGREAEALRSADRVS